VADAGNGLEGPGDLCPFSGKNAVWTFSARVFFTHLVASRNRPKLDRGTHDIRQILIPSAEWADCAVSFILDLILMPICPRLSEMLRQVLQSQHEFNNITNFSSPAV